jgi:hypothetical protein
MKYNEIVATEEINEAPMGVLGQAGNWLGSKLTPIAPGFGSKSTGKLNVGKLANQLHKEFNYYIGNSHQQPTAKVLLDFLKAKKLPTTDASKLVNKYNKFINDYYTAQAKEKPAAKGDWKAAVGNVARNTMGIDPRMIPSALGLHEAGEPETPEQKRLRKQQMAQQAIDQQAPVPAQPSAPVNAIPTPSPVAPDPNSPPQTPSTQQFSQNYTSAAQPSQAKSQVDANIARQTSIKTNKQQALGKPLSSELIDKVLMAAAAEAQKTSASNFYQNADQQYQYAPPKDMTGGTITPNGVAPTTPTTPSSQVAGTVIPPGVSQEAQAIVDYLKVAKPNDQQFVLSSLTNLQKQNYQQAIQAAPMEESVDLAEVVWRKMKSKQ